jgi:hypothetical protein
MTANLQNPIFLDDIKAREWLEARVWPNGPVCPHCGATGDDVTAHHRSLGISYKSSWFMMHRLREALRQGSFDVPMGSGGAPVEVDETYFGKQAGHAKGKCQGHMNAVLTLVERGGKSRTFHVDGTSIADLAPVLRRALEHELDRQEVAEKSRY